MDLDTDNKVLVLLGWLPYLLEGTMTESEIETATMTESEIETATMTESEIETATGTEPYTRYHGTSLISV